MPGRRTTARSSGWLRPTTWNELTDDLFAGAWNAPLARHRSPFAFRGTGRISTDLSSGLLRLAAGRDPVSLEQHLLRNFRKYAHSAVGERSIWHWLALAQHRGLPTRLLDWTYSPFVALHFATASLTHMDQDGSVWMVEFVRANERLPRSLRRTLMLEGSDTWTVEMLERFRTLREFDRFHKDPFVLFVEPPSLDPRITNQFALFSLMPGAGSRLDVWLRQEPMLVRRIIVPASLKWEIRDKLDQLNINERVLFPGLDGLTRWLTRYYWQRRRPGTAGALRTPLAMRATPR